MTEDVQARRFVVRGRVQGVGFRWFVEREAHILGIAGWVRNNADGGVEVLAQGTRDQLSGLRSRLREGPRAARVDAVERAVGGPGRGNPSFRNGGALGSRFQRFKVSKCQGKIPAFVFETL